MLKWIETKSGHSHDFYSECDNFHIVHYTLVSPKFYGAYVKIECTNSQGKTYRAFGEYVDKHSARYKTLGAAKKACNKLNKIMFIKQE